MACMHIWNERVNYRSIPVLMMLSCAVFDLNHKVVSHNEDGERDKEFTTNREHLQTLNITTIIFTNGFDTAGIPLSTSWIKKWCYEKVFNLT